MATLSLAQFAEGQGVIRPIHVTLLELERAFLTDQRGWGTSGLEHGVLYALRQLRQIAEALDLELGRRDNSFRRHRQLRRLQEHTIWLLHGLGREMFLQIELALEAELKSLISPEAHAVYLRLVEAEALEEEFMALGEVELQDRLLTGTLEREWPVTGATPGSGAAP